MVLLLLPQMPLANHAGDIAGLLHGIGQSDLSQRKAMINLALAGGIVFMAEALLVTPGQQSCPGGGANGRCDVAGIKQGAVIGNPLHIGRRVGAASVELAVAVAEIIDIDENNIGTPLL